MNLKAADFKNQNKNYDVEFRIKSDGWLQIEKAKLTITVKDQTYTYNGTPQGEDGGKYTNDTSADPSANDKVTVEGLQGQDKLWSIKLNQAKQTDAGTYTGALTVDSSVDADTAIAHGNIKQPASQNYDVTYVAGALIIKGKKLTVNIIGNTAKKTYNGEEQTVDDYTIECDDPAYTKDDIITARKPAAKGTNVGTYNMNLKAAD